MGIPWKKIFTAGLAGATALNPGVGALLAALVASVEAVKGSGNGQDKEDAVVAAFTATLALSEGIAAKDLLDDSAYQDAVRKAIKAVVAVENAVASLKH